MSLSRHRRAVRMGREGVRRGKRVGCDRPARARWMLIAWAVVLTFLATVGAAPAAADSLLVSVSPNPVLYTSATDTVVVSGSTTVDPYYLYLYASYKPVASGGCAATYDLDTGEIFAQAQALSQAADGSFSGQVNLSPSLYGLDPGTYLICVWVAHSDNSQFGASTQLTVRPPNATITLSPPVAEPNGQGFRVKISYGLETAPGEVLVDTYNDTAGKEPCPANENDQDPNQQGETLAILYKQFANGGPFSGTTIVRARVGDARFLPGLWRICGYVDNGGGIGYVLFARAAANVIIPQVGAPRCQVPNLRGKSLSRAKKALVVAHCEAGRIAREKRLGKRAGTLLSQSVPPGRTLPRGSTVGLVVAQ